MIQNGNKILFQGDSITDCGRNKTAKPEEPNQHHQLGMGYVMMTAASILAEQPDKQLQFFNRGISGHRVVDLYARWKIDTLNLKPDVLSILIGVNDTWHHFKRDNGVEPERYEQIYRMMLQWTRETLPDVKLVLCDPFYLDCGEVGEGWKEDLLERQNIVKKLAEDYDAKHVQFQAMFDQACASAPPEFWAYDGVHPSPAGHKLMSDLWIKTVLG